VLQNFERAALHNLLTDHSKPPYSNQADCRIVQKKKNKSKFEVDEKKFGPPTDTVQVVEMQSPFNQRILDIQEGEISVCNMT